MNIGFIALFNNTIFYKAIADELEKDGHSIFWITSSKKRKTWLINNGTLAEKIVLLNKSVLNVQIIEKGKQLINEIERKTNEKVNNIILMDRILRHWNYRSACEYVYSISNTINEFLLKNDIEIVISEGTTVQELITAILCKYNNKNFYNPGTMRIPSDRFLFFKGYLQKEYEKFEEFDSNSTRDLSERVEEIKIGVRSGVKPNYFYWNDQIPKINISWFSKVIEKIKESLIESRNDATVKSLGYHLFKEPKYLKPFRYFRARSLFEKPDLETKYALYTMHMQPESGIDVFGAKTSNQLDVIEKISRELPVDMVLYVKEHSNCLGDRSVSYLKAIQRLPGVKLIDPFFSTHKLIERCQIVFTICGTVGFEAGFFGKKTVLFSQMYFDGLSSVISIINSNQISTILKKESEEFTAEDKLFIENMLNNSFEGIISDPISAPICISDENLKRVSFAFRKLIDLIQNRNECTNKKQMLNED
ncbi:hypothetical protein [Paenibacillus thalictri]|uniref:Capsule polysaccharide biosynthesis protein n=1 Tax=Paenibacillus thalictri TaxID=2527873 RepID=A0A4Q9DDU5_9BACL|nr:hypothetical protein [Paenibacillus thalictri]TBL67773.1 hypothetical protein EYB31_39265 [Paenibacillus thalictri]